jgi:[glutamine synthetase] adenylyltransferase / [glutamine synthetase]-adenylyl-L-tyrosine phosphorylase
VKLGRGGIREIEFFVQTQQLIAGGRNPALRGLRTLDMLDALAEAQWIAVRIAKDMKDAYRFLRDVEHRLQMVNDEQTHLLPATEEGFASFSAFMGLEPDVLKAKLRTTFETVQSHYAALFESADDLGHELGNLVFTGGEDDPETLETLGRMGFKRASEISAAIRSWHFGRYAAMRSGRAREIMTEIVPRLLTALSKSGDADQAFIAFDVFLGQLPAGVQLLSMLQANPQLLDLIATILGTAPRLAAQMGARPRILEAVLDPGFFGLLPTLADLRASAATVLPLDLSLEDMADHARVFGRERMFRISVRVLSDTVGAEEAGAAFADLAQTILERLHAAVTEDMIRRHGRVPGGSSCIVAMGKLGGREMTASSDLDLMLIYDHGPDATGSDGQRPLSPAQYYAKLTQRLITLITAPTSEGKLYDVDMRLRPSGSQGPVATSLQSFSMYHRESAWTWEKLALTRARVMAGEARLATAISDAAQHSLCAPRDRNVTRNDVLDMRQLMLKEQKTTGHWDIKRTRGGLVEVEFIAQFLQIAHAAQAPGVLAVNTGESLDHLAAKGFLDPDAHRQLRNACQLYQRLTQVLRLCVDAGYQPETAPSGLNALVARAAEMPDIRTAEALLVETQSRVAGIFDKIIGRP